MPDTITEAERQVLIALIELTEPIETPNNTHYTFYPNSLDEAAGYFLTFREDWAPAYASLCARGLLRSAGSGYELTAAGTALAQQERSDHPPIWYWYRAYYTLTASSQVYSRFCETLYGRDLCQTDFSDMDQIDLLLKVAGLKPGDRVLELGCGSGLFAEYLSDRTGASVWGVDYVPEAIQQAQRRAARQPAGGKCRQLDFRTGNFDHLQFEPGAFDLIISIDTLYMPNDLPATLRVLNDLLAPGGRMLIYYMTMLFDPTQPRTLLQPDHSDLALALRQVGLPYQTWDLSEPTFHLMRRKYQLAQSMRADFEGEGTLFLYNHLAAESDSGVTPYDPKTTHLSRYLYQVKKAVPQNPPSSITS